MFMIDGVLTTPSLNTAILDGITRDSILTIARDMGMSVEERRITVDEIEQGFKAGKITEVFGAGTAAVVAPVSTINIKGTDYSIADPKPDSFQLTVKQLLHDMRMGTKPDKYNWNHIIKMS
jgi:branched-chain amino acid aminotransferase